MPRKQPSSVQKSTHPDRPGGSSSKTSLLDPWPPTEDLAQLAPEVPTQQVPATEDLGAEAEKRASLSHSDWVRLGQSVAMRFSRADAPKKLRSSTPPPPAEPEPTQVLAEAVEATQRLEPSPQAFEATQRLEPSPQAFEATQRLAPAEDRSPLEATQVLHPESPVLLGGRVVAKEAYSRGGSKRLSLKSRPADADPPSAQAQAPSAKASKALTPGLAAAEQLGPGGSGNRASTGQRAKATPKRRSFTELVRLGQAMRGDQVPEPVSRGRAELAIEATPAGPMELSTVQALSASETPRKRMRTKQPSPVKAGLAPKRLRFDEVSCEPESTEVVPTEATAEAGEGAPVEREAEEEMEVEPTEATIPGAAAEMQADEVLGMDISLLASEVLANVKSPAGGECQASGKGDGSKLHAEDVSTSSDRHAEALALLREEEAVAEEAVRQATERRDAIIKVIRDLAALI